MSPRGMGVGHFDSDADPDIVIASRLGDDVCVLLGDGHGGFGPSTDYAVGDSPGALAVADFDGDGHSDVVVANSASEDVSVLLSDGQGGFGVATAYAVGSAPSDVAADDLDGDGDADFVVTDANLDALVFLGDGQGGFGAPVSYPAGGNAVAIADVDGDGVPDLVLANTSARTVVILLGDGQGAFGAGTIFHTTHGLTSLVIVDLDLDGDLDIAAGGFGTAASVLLGNGQGAFGPELEILLAPGYLLTPVAVAFGDFDEDGLPDMAAASEGVTVIRNAGPTALGAVSRYAAGFTRTVAVADFDRDGHRDIAVSIDPINCCGHVAILRGDGEGRFAAARNAPVGVNALSATIADLDLDGFPDLAVANTGSHSVSVVLGDGLGEFGPSSFELFTGGGPRAVASGDFNGDGDADLVVTNSFEDSVTVLVNGQSVTDYAVGNQPDSIAIGDFDADGDDDLAVLNASPTVSILLGDGQGGFGAATDFGAGWNPRSVVTADFDGDGALDLALANGSPETVSLLLGDGLGSFGPPATFAVGNQPVSVVAADFDGDGFGDLAVAGQQTPSLVILLGDGTGGFGAPTSLDPGFHALAVGVGDFNLDGRVDLVAAGLGGVRTVAVLPGDGQGGFGDPTRLVGSGHRFIAVGDVDSDGASDFAVVNGLDVTVFLNTCRNYRGSGDDLVLETRVNAFGNPLVPLESMGAGDVLEVTYRSPGGSLDGLSTFLAGQLFATANPTASPPGFPEIHLDPLGVPSPVIAHVTPALLPGGATCRAAAPPGLEGSSLLLQAITPTPSARNGIFAGSDGHEVLFVSLPAPVISSVVPLLAPVGAEITISGANFSVAATLHLGGLSVPILSVTPTEIRFCQPIAVPCDALLTVTNPDGRSASAAGFNPSPVITSMSATLGAITGGESLTLNGANFSPGTTVTMGGVTAVITSLQEQAITVITPPGAVGPVPLVLTAPNGCVATTIYSYVALQPRIFWVSPSSAFPGDAITISGDFFLPGLTVAVDGAPVTPLSVSLTQVVFPYPARASCDTTVVVTNPDGASVQTPFNPTPVISDVADPTGPAAGGATFVVTGGDFAVGTSVTVGSAPATVLGNFGIALFVTAPPGVPGPATIVVTTPGGCSAVATYTYF